MQKPPTSWQEQLWVPWRWQDERTGQKWWDGSVLMDTEGLQISENQKTLATAQSIQTVQPSFCKPGKGARAHFSVARQTKDVLPQPQLGKTTKPTKKTKPVKSPSTHLVLGKTVSEHRATCWGWSVDSWGPPGKYLQLYTAMQKQPKQWPMPSLMSGWALLLAVNHGAQMVFVHPPHLFQGISSSCAIVGQSLDWRHVNLPQAPTKKCSCLSASLMQPLQFRPVCFDSFTLVDVVLPAHWAQLYPSAAPLPCPCCPHLPQERKRKCEEDVDA